MPQSEPEVYESRALQVVFAGWQLRSAGIIGQCLTNCKGFFEAVLRLKINGIRDAREGL